ncbi:hypothetical protein [Paenibacillus luteus]|uniref:hypothetical protein n=1 Tax=Paenibacillus luteus TaxID=2545753 RepID=UPI0011420AD6|nr:hypothetical protein [Paenibacillus luteus]
MRRTELERNKWYLKKARVGVITVGHELYWGQIHRLREELEGYGRQFEQMVGRCDVEVISGGFVVACWATGMTCSLLIDSLYEGRFFAVRRRNGFLS